jgi:predicted O-methyltransferase YrrM
MHRAALALIVLSALTLPAAAQRGRGPRAGSRSETLPTPNSEAERRLFAETTGAKAVVELGTSTGISGLWLAMALQKTGGKLTTFEYDAGRAATARRNFKEAGVDTLVTVVEGDAHQTLSRVTGPIDMVFIDADKEGYVDYLNQLLPLVRPGGLILAHNIDQVQSYLQQVHANPALETILYLDGGGMGVTLKKR